MKKHRQAEGLFVAEGRKVIEELSKLLPPVEIFEGEDARKLSFLQHPQGVLALFPTDMMQQIVPQSKLKLALDGVQDPGNLGTIIRIADWFGIDHILCSQDTVDCFNPKVVQATMGSLARVKVEYLNLYETLKSYTSPRGGREGVLFGTLLDGENIYTQDLPDEGIIVMGNEGNGISDEVRKLVTHKLLIPSFPPNRPTAESLNVAIATALVCGEFRRRNNGKQ